MAPKKRGRGLLATLLALVLAAAAGAGYLWRDDAAAKGDRAQPDGEARTAKAAATRPPQFVPLEVLTVNLRDDGSVEQYLQVGLTYQVSDAQVAEAMKTQMPIIRSNILLLLSSKTPKEIATLEGKARLGEELLLAARRPLPGSEDSPKGITAVHYSSFIIQ